MMDDLPQFDIGLNTSDHHFANLKFCPQNPTLFRTRMIDHEWKLLRETLPPTVFVHVNDCRLNLMRAVIIGRPGTPYHDGLYFFDIAFPDDFPSRPPRFHYRPYSCYGDYVYLTLASTSLFGEKKWNPSTSSTLEVLVSIQDLVLCEKPYYNEPFILGPLCKCEADSDSYNEHVFISCCKTMLDSLRKPPQNFESLVMKHFNERGRVILEACVAYAKNRAKVGYYRCDVSCPCNVSEDFKLMMMDLVPKMVDAFTMNGGSSELESFVEKVGMKRSKKKTRFFETVKEVLGLNTYDLSKKLV